MPASDDHLQDPQLARALRDLDLPGPVVPSLTADEVRRRGSRRRTRRHAAWAGSGLLVAAVAGALVVGPLTPDRSGRGPTSAAGSPDQAAVAPSVTGPQATGPQATPRPSESAAKSATPESYATNPPPVATLDLGKLRLTTHIENGAGTDAWWDIYLSGAAFDVFAKNPVPLRVTGLFRTYDLPGYSPDFGKDYAEQVPWVVSLKAADGTVVYIGSPPTCTASASKCPPAADRPGLIGVFGEEWAKMLYDALEINDRIEVVGTDGKAAATTPADPSARGKYDPETGVEPTSGRAVTETTSASPRPSGSRAPGATPTSTPGTSTAAPASMGPSDIPSSSPTGGVLVGGDPPTRA